MTELQWFEYDKAEEQVEALTKSINEAMEDIEFCNLSKFSRMAILNEIERYTHYRSDILELMGEQS